MCVVSAGIVLFFLLFNFCSQPAGPQSHRRALMRLKRGARGWRVVATDEGGKARGALFCEYVDEGHACNWDRDRWWCGVWVGWGWGCTVSVRHALYCLYALYGEPDSQQIAGVWCDPDRRFVWGALADEAREGEVGEQGATLEGDTHARTHTRTQT